MLSPEEDVEANALRRQGWTISAIARHLHRARPTIRAYLAGTRQPGQRIRSAPNLFAAFVPYVEERLREDPHLWATTLYDEVRDLGYQRSYQRFTHELRVHQLRPHCEPCAGVKGRPTIEIEHPPGVEIQWDFLELPAAWGDVHLLVGTLSHSGRARAAVCEQEDEAHVIQGIDAVLRRLGGTARRWRFDRMAAVVHTRSGAVRAGFLAVAKYYGVGIDVCPPRRGNRKGVVESRNHFLAQRWWRTAEVAEPAEVQASVDRFCARVADALPRFDSVVQAVAERETLLSLPAAPYPATLSVARKVDLHALVAFEGNSYGVAPGFVGREVRVRTRLGSGVLDILAGDGSIIATHRQAVAASHVIVRTGEQHRALESAVLAASTTRQPCRRKQNHPPGPAARAAAARLRGHAELVGAAVVVDLQRYASAVETTS
jgi:transposase